MANSTHFDELVVSYLSNELNNEEEAFILEWINSSEENKKYFEALKSTWQLLVLKQSVKKLDIESEWNQFRQAIVADQQIHLSQTPETEITEGPAQTILRESTPNLRRHYISWAVAASIILLLTGGWLYFSNHEQVATINLQQPGRDSSHWTYAETTRFNTTTEPILLLLPDGSEVKLDPNSSIVYHDPFTGNAREVSLNGKANFKVVKDTSRPFTVSSGDIATTALGTQFTITAFDNDENITLRLYEGKVVIKPAGHVKQQFPGVYYLLPGQELDYSNFSHTATIRKFGLNSLQNLAHTNKSESTLTDHPSIPKLGKTNWYMFNNQPLYQVLDQLSVMFSTGIVYKKKDFSGIYIIGTFNKSDSLQYILQQIGRLNKLQITKKKNSYIIKRYR